ncbi:unnamed protein product [Chironomus riparius]|uniref:RIIa domain-containing protein n=1 Tax=Chironomus riparius TaxID=315576 RepID=A0A9N9WST8_9DIPT|nr:unnamed protein product [Chironomus riparius]
MPIISPKIPQGLEELMKGLAKSVIKENPDNIYEFAAEYFENLLRERDGTDDQNYKKFATYKVYKKSRMERRKREREIISNIDTEKGQLQHERILSSDDKVSSDQNDEDNSIEKITLDDCEPPMKVMSQDIIVSTESEINTTIKQDSFVEDEGSPQKSVNSEDEDIKGLVLDDDMANAALKIQSTFRGHKVRKEMKETQQNDSLIEEENVGDKIASKEEVDENNQINDTESDEIIKKSDEECEAGNSVEEKDEINLESHSTEANENEFNDDEIAHDGKLSVENVDAMSENEELLSSAENNIEENLQPENVILMEQECNAEQIITNESTQSFDNVEINLKDVQDDVIESENVQTTLTEYPEANDNVNLEDKDDISAMVLDDEMEEAALKIQSAFRGHQVRKDMNQKDITSTDNASEEICEEKEILADSENVIEEIVNEEQELENKISEELVSTLELNQEEIIDGNDDIINNDDEENLSKVEAIMESELSPEENVNEIEVDTTELNSNQVEEELAIEMSNEQVDAVVENEKPETDISIEGCENEQTVEQSEESKADERAMSQEILENNKQEDAVFDELKETQTVDISGNNEGEILKPDDAELEQVSDEKIVEHHSKENVVDNSDENNEEQQEEIIDVDKASPTDIDYEVLCESTNSLDKIENNEAPEVVDVASPTNIDYEELCESIESPEKLESKATTNENSIDADTKSIDSKTSFGNELDDQQESQIKLENILSDFISPYDLYDEVVNTQATFMNQNESETLVDENDELEEAAVKIQSAFRGHKTRMEIKSQHDTVKESSETESAPNAEEKEEVVDDDIKNMVLDDEMEQAALKIQSSFRGHKVRKQQKNDEDKKDEDNIHSDEPVEISLDDRSEEQIEKITNPELLDLSEKDEQTNENDEIRDEILTPDKDESEIPEENNVPFDDIPYPKQENCNADENLEPNLSEEKVEENDSKKLSNDEENNEIDDMILDEEMEDAALKIQAVFRGHQVRKEKYSNATNDTELSKQDESTNNETIVIEQCSEGNEDTQDNDENEQQDTSADVDEIQECEAAEQENETEETEEVNEAEEVNENEEETTETNEQGGDDPDEPEQAEGESSEQQQNNDDDDVANMVLDEEMEQAALKIQSTFRGHKARSEVKPKQEVEASKEDSVQNIDDEIANMVLDDEMEQAALKIQSAFRGNKSKKEETTTQESKEEEEEENKEKEKPEEEKNEPSSSGESSEKTAKQLQDEEDIASIVMDDEMEKTALKIQSAFRGKIKRKTPKDGLESYESSADDYNADAEESLQKSDENVGDMYEFFSASVECDDEDERGNNSYDDDDYNEYLAKRESYANDGSYSIDRYNNTGMDAYNETIYPSDNDNDIDLMHGGGIFPETSGESGTLESFAGYLSEDNNNNNDPPEDKREFSNRMSESSLKDDDTKELIEQKSEEKVIETYDFNSNKDSAEALYYSLKKNEIEAQKRFESDTSQDMNDFQSEMNEKNDNESLEKEEYIPMDDDDDDDDVVVSPSNDVQKLKYGMSMDDRLLGSILSQDYTKGRKMYPDESFDPLLEEAMSSNYSVLEKMNEYSKSGDDRKINDNNDGEEDQFDDFFPGNIRSKIMASSISIADSDYFDPTNNKSIIDDDRIRTALETIHSTDSESTIGSATTKIQAGDKGLITYRNKTFQYSSIGNAAIDKSLDEFIQSQELKIDRFEEEPEGYNSPPPKKQESADDFTDDTCTESEKRPTMAGIIEIKLEQKNFLTIDERRRTLHREDAIQRNSTRSVDEDPSKSANASHDKNQNQMQTETTTTSVQGQNSVIDTEIAVPVLEKPKTNVNMKPVKVPMRRQKTMPVQIESNVIRVLPKHLRKRIKSADSDKKKRIQKQ